MSRVGIVVTACVVLIAIAIFMLRNDQQRDSNAFAIAGTQRGEHEAPVLAQLDPPNRSGDPRSSSSTEGDESLPEAPANRPTARSYLAEYWGSEWPRIEAAMLQYGLDLDQPFQIRPWEEACIELGEKARLDDEEMRRQIEHVMAWPKDATAESLQGMIPGLEISSEDDLNAVLQAAAPFNEELKLLGETWAARIDLYVREKWSRGDYARAPFTTLGVSTERGFYSTSPAGQGWAAQVVLKHEEYPDMVELMEKSNTLIDRRNAALIRLSRR